ncbi:MscL family protein [Candidatus Saccharibacteria bacterium]|nr:MscL family protein [Candidatus Saccharibacteria bacterium]
MGVKEEIDKVCGKARRAGLVQFLSEQGVVGLAVGIVLGTATAAVVNSFINNVIMPPVGLLLGSTDGLRGLAIDMTARSGEIVQLRYGAFLNDFINFAVIVTVLYFVIKWLKVELKKKN